MGNLHSHTETGSLCAKKGTGVRKGAFELGAMPISKDPEKNPAATGTAESIIKNLIPVLESKPLGKTGERGAHGLDKTLTGSAAPAPLTTTAGAATNKSPEKAAPVRVKSPDEVKEEVMAKIKSRAKSAAPREAVSGPKAENMKTTAPRRPGIEPAKGGANLRTPASDKVSAERAKTQPLPLRSEVITLVPEKGRAEADKPLNKTVIKKTPPSPSIKAGQESIEEKTRPRKPASTIIEKAKAEAQAHIRGAVAAKDKKSSKDKPAALTEARKETAEEPAPEGPSCDLNAAPRTSHLTKIFYTVLILVLFLGWFYSGEQILTAKEGLGYYIGIIGGAMMLALIIYPLRKTARFMRGMGAIRHWFRAHMILGLIGPVLIVFHANFAVGSLNSSIALGAMVLVALSGLVGRYIYAGIHYGLYGKEMDFKGLKQDFEHKISVMKYVLDYAPALQQRLKDLDARAAKPRYSFLGSLLGLITTWFNALWLRMTLILGLRRTLRVAARRNKWSPAELKAHSMATRYYISNHISAAKAISRFKVYERLFSLWHLLHMPLFLMLVLTAIIHVVAVHMF